MTRILSYNILAGGYDVRNNNKRRSRQLTSIIRSAQPDVVGLVEAINPTVQRKPLVIEELAEALDMQLLVSGDGKHDGEYQLAMLTRLPVIYIKQHSSANAKSRLVMEVCVEEEDGQQLTIFLTHLSAAFNQWRAGQHLRQREVQRLLHLMAPLRIQNKPHMVMGDFNSLAPRDPFKANNLIRYLMSIDSSDSDFQMADGHPSLNFVIPPRLKFTKPILRFIPKCHLSSAIFNTAAALYAPRGCIRLLQDAGYVDCYRRVHPRAWGFTCPAAAPAGRIDFIFANPTLAERLETCYVLIEGEEGMPGSCASDHLAVGAEFGLRLRPGELDTQHDSVMIG